MSINKVKNLLIIEKSSSVLDFKKDEKGYVLEGIFGEIGVRNKNNRIYDENEYLPQIESLQQKIGNSKLLGELDHPQSFDISLKNASHVIEELYYDKENKQVRGKIRLLNTEAGKQAQALVEDGIPLHISSRAAGVVESNGHVRIKKLFTYDLVADPGFENAQLNRVTESFGFESNSGLEIYEFDGPIPGVDDKYPIKENNTENMEGVVKVEDFNTYSKHLTEQINSLKKEIATLKEARPVSEDAGNTEAMQGYINKLSGKINEMYGYLKYVAENVDNVIQHNDSIVENIQALQGYVNEVAEKADQGILYSEDIGKRANKIVEHNNYLAKHVDFLAQFADTITENMESIVEYSEYLKNGIETVGQYGDYTAENVKKLKTRLASLNEEDKAKEIEKDITKLGEPKEEDIKKGDTVVGEKKEEPKTEPAKVEETKAEPELTTEKYKQEIFNKLDLIIESAKKQTVDADGNLHFMRFLGNTKRNEFYALTETVQLKLVDAYKDKKYTSEQDVNLIWESVINPAPKKLNFIDNMPNEYRETWDKMSQNGKNKIIAESQYHNLNSQYQIDNFWQTRDLRDVQVDITKINESKTAAELAGETKKESDIKTYNGVSEEYLKNFHNTLAQKFGKY